MFPPAVPEMPIVVASVSPLRRELPTGIMSAPATVVTGMYFATSCSPRIFVAASLRQASAAWRLGKAFVPPSKSVLLLPKVPPIERPLPVGPSRLPPPTEPPTVSSMR